MKLVRAGLMIVGFVLLGGGYAASQVALLNGNVAETAWKFDQTPVRALAAVVFVGAIILCFVRDPEAS